MTRDDRIAASECVRIMALLANASTPHSKSLAIIVGTRLAEILDNGAGDPLDDEELAPWLDIARELRRLQ